MFDVKDRKISITQMEHTSVVNKDYSVLAGHVDMVNLMQNC